MIESDCVVVVGTGEGAWDDREGVAVGDGAGHGFLAGEGVGGAC